MSSVTAQRQSLRVGTIVEYDGVRAMVLRDSGGPSIEVRSAGHCMTWAWAENNPLCRVVEVPRGATHYRSFAAYVADFPEGETFRAWLTSRGRGDCTLVKLSDDPEVVGAPHSGVPGNFMWITLTAFNETLRLAANDCDDGLMVRDFRLDQRAEAEQVLQDMCALAPMTMWEAAEVFDFKWD